MPFTANFTAQQNLGNLATLTLIDTSTGTTESFLTARVVTITAANGDNVPVSSTWIYSSATKDYANILKKDVSYEIKVDWINNAQQIIYTKTILFCFTGYSDTFLLNLTRWQTSNQQLVNSANYWQNKSKLRCLVDDAQQAVALGNDQTASQICLDLAKDLTDNQENFY